MRLSVLALVLLSVPVFAQDDPALPDAERGADLMQRGLEALLQGFAAQMQPALRDMGDALADLRPMAEKLIGLVDDIGNYEAPVVLENGDILIRRKPAPPEPLKEGEIEL